MNTQEIDRRIGMPDIDAEWAKFEQEVINLENPVGKHTFFKSWMTKAAIITGIIFLLGGAGIATAVITSKSNLKFASIFEPDEPVYDIVENNPDYPGGIENFWQFLANNLHYPQIAQDCGIQGRVIVQFVVEIDGRCTQFKVLKEITDHQKLIKRETPAIGTPKDRDFITQAEFEKAQKACTEEALRVLKRMDKWTPGKIKGEAVRTHFTVPITFRLK